MIVNVLKKPAVLVLMSFVLGLLFGGIYVHGLEDEPLPQTTVFLTVGLDESQVVGEFSLYDSQRAAEHFSNVILGWTIEPSFSEELLDISGEVIDFKGRRQEKQNLIFTLGVEDGEAFVTLIERRLSEYNEANQSAYGIALERSHLDWVEPAKGRIVMGAGFGLASVMILILFVWPYAFANCRRSTPAA